MEGKFFFSFNGIEGKNGISIDKKKSYLFENQGRLMASQLEDLLPRYKHVLKAHLHMTQIRIIGLNKPPNHAHKNSIFSLTSSIWTYHK